MAESKRIFYSRIQGNYPRTIFNEATRVFAQAFKRTPSKQEIHVGLGKANFTDTTLPNKPQELKFFGRFAIRR